MVIWDQTVAVAVLIARHQYSLAVGAGWVAIDEVKSAGFARCLQNVQNPVGCLTRIYAARLLYPVMAQVALHPAIRFACCVLLDH